MIVLIVDDDRLVRFAIKSMLSEFMEDSTDLFLEAANGRDMVTVCSEKKPDVVFADISMPYMNGLDAIDVEIDQPISEIDEIQARMSTARAGLEARRNKNQRIKANFKSLLCEE